MQTRAPSSISATDQVAAVGSSGGSRLSARDRSALVTEGPGNSCAEATLASTRRTLVSRTTWRLPWAKTAMAAAV